MTLQEFTAAYDTPNSVVLLEGKRNVAEEDKDRLVELGGVLASRTSHITFRSGNAAGADYYFSKGIAEVAPDRLQVVTPYTGHRKKSNHAGETFPLDQVNLANEPEVIYQAKTSGKMDNLIDQYVAGRQNRNTVKAAYIIRDTLKVTGTGEIRPATFGLFYDDLQKPRAGGTGHTMEVCEKNGIPFFDQSAWLGWVE